MRKSFRALAIAAAVAATPMAFAQDNTANATTPHRFSVVGGYAHMVPKSDPGSIAGSQADRPGANQHLHFAAHDVVHAVGGVAAPDDLLSAGGVVRLEDRRDLGDAGGR